jgi:hypothetical protein
MHHGHTRPAPARCRTPPLQYQLVHPPCLPAAVQPSGCRMRSRSWSHTSRSNTSSTARGHPGALYRCCTETTAVLMHVAVCHRESCAAGNISAAATAGTAGTVGAATGTIVVALLLVLPAPPELWSLLPLPLPTPRQTPVLPGQPLPIAASVPY